MITFSGRLRFTESVVRYVKLVVLIGSSNEMANGVMENYAAYVALSVTVFFGFHRNGNIR